jgi:hypothetical protein
MPSGELEGQGSSCFSCVVVTAGRIVCQWCKVPAGCWCYSSIASVRGVHCSRTAMPRHHALQAPVLGTLLS